MQLHQLPSANKKQQSKRVGRGGKRGTYSGHGIKGQKARAGARIRPGFRGGDNPIWKLFPKQRGASKKTEIKHRSFSIQHYKPAVLNLITLNQHFLAGDIVSPKTVLKKGLTHNIKYGVKILGQGQLSHKLIFEGVEFSESAKEKVLQSGSTIK